MKSFKFIGLGLLAVLVLVVLAGGVIVWRFDPAWAAQKLAQAVYEQKQRTLKIEGGLAISFFPSLGIRLGKTTISEHASTQEFASVENARVSVRILPLLSRQLVVDRIELDGMDAHIVRGKDGRFNFDDLLSSGQEAGKAPVTTPQGKAITFNVAGIDITRSAISYRDDVSGRAMQLTDVSVKTGRLSQAASGPVQLAFQVDSRQPQVKAAVHLDGNYRYDLARKHYDIEKLNLTVKGDAFGINALDTALKANSAQWDGAQGTIQLEALALATQGRLGSDVLSATFELPRVASVGKAAKGQSGTANVRLTGKDRQAQAKLDLSGIEASTSALRIDSVSAQWTLKRGTLAALGKTNGAMNVDFNARLLSAPKLKGELQIADPALPVKQLELPLDASVRVDWGNSQAAGNLSTRLDDSSVQGKFQVTKFSPLAANLDLALDKLDIDRYFPQAPPARAAPPVAPKPGPATPIDFSFLRGLDLKGALRVGFLQVRNLKLNNVSGQLVVNNGRADLNPLSANLYGGKLAGSLSAQADGNRVEIKQALDNVTIGPLIRDYAHKDILEGRGQLALDVNGAGSSVAAVRQSLNGSARVNLRNGAVKGINLAKALREGKALLAGGKQDSVIAANKTEQTDFSEMSASLRITNGVARNDDLSVKSPFLRATGAGTIDLVREQIDYLAKVTVVASAKGQEGKELADLNGLTIPVRLTGAYDNPSYRLEFGALAAELAKQQLQKRLEQQVQKQLGGNKALGDVLKGLIN